MLALLADRGRRSRNGYPTEVGDRQKLKSESLAHEGPNCPYIMYCPHHIWDMDGQGSCRGGTFTSCHSSLHMRSKPDVSGILVDPWGPLVQTLELHRRTQWRTPYEKQAKKVWSHCSKGLHMESVSWTNPILNPQKPHSPISNGTWISTSFYTRWAGCTWMVIPVRTWRQWPWRSNPQTVRQIRLAYQSTRCCLSFRFCSRTNMVSPLSQRSLFAICCPRPRSDRNAALDSQIIIPSFDSDASEPPDWSSWFHIVVLTLGSMSEAEAQKEQCHKSQGQWFPVVPSCLAVTSLVPGPRHWHGLTCWAQIFSWHVTYGN